MNPVTVKLRGVAEVQRNLYRLAKKYPKVTLKAANRQFEFIMTDSKRDYCPVRDGHLRSSGHVVADEAQLEVTMGYGGPAGTGNQGESNTVNVGYAVPQHENEEYKHTVGGPKYLERPLMAKVPTLATDIASEVLQEIQTAGES